MKFYLSLAVAICLLAGMVLTFLGCTGVFSGIPTYPEATKVRLSNADKDTFVSSGIVNKSYLLFKHDLEISWSDDLSSAVRNRLDKALPKQKWRLVTDWNGTPPILMSEWKNGDRGLLVILIDNLDDKMISDLERRYGFTNLKTGITLITMFVFDKNKTLPDKTATIQARNQETISTSEPPASSPTPAQPTTTP